MNRNLLEGLLKCSRLPATQSSDSAGLGWNPRICISYKFPGDADGAGLGYHSLSISLLAKGFALKIITLCGDGEGDMGSLFAWVWLCRCQDYEYEINVGRWIRFYTRTPSPSPDFSMKCFCVPSSAIQWICFEGVICACEVELLMSRWNRCVLKRGPSTEITIIQGVQRRNAGLDG